MILILYKQKKCLRRKFLTFIATFIIIERNALPTLKAEPIFMAFKLSIVVFRTSFEKYNSRVRVWHVYYFRVVVTFWKIKIFDPKSHLILTLHID